MRISCRFRSVVDCLATGAFPCAGGGSGDGNVRCLCLCVRLGARYGGGNGIYPIAAICIWDISDGVDFIFGLFQFCGDFVRSIRRKNAATERRLAGKTFDLAIALIGGDCLLLYGSIHAV